jgi:hypothetical protein
MVDYYEHLVMASSSFVDHHRHRVIKLAELGFRSFPGDSEVRLGTSHRWVSNQVRAPPTTSPKTGSSRFRFGTDGLCRRCGIDASIPGIHISFVDLVFEQRQFRQRETANRLNDVEVDRFRRKLERNESTTGPGVVRTLRDGRKSVERTIRKKTVFIVRPMPHLRVFRYFLRRIFRFSSFLLSLSLRIQTASSEVGVKIEEETPKITMRHPGIPRSNV